MKKILITGSSGMVGRNILEFHKAYEYEIISPSSRELNLLDISDVDTYIKSNKPDIIIHCAGIVGGIQANINSPVKFISQNTLMGHNIIISAFENGVRNFLNMGSSCMYPRDAKNPLKEESILKGELEPTNEGYAISKIFSTRLCEYVNKENPDYNYKTIVPCNLYGRYDSFEDNKSHMIPAVIKKVHQAKVNNIGIIEIWGDGKARREFMFAEDLANFTYYALENIDSMPQNINVGLGFDFSIDEYYQTIAEIIGFSGKFKHDLSKPVGMRQKLIDDTLLDRFGWKHKISLKDGIKRTYDYYLKEVLND
ncbi:GDP-L-fucose synthase [Allofrancisella guangzhouensis]|uniref:GDP-L-fucose synthase n=1 Tax=Allofrancisella guangzhouensis TaxID=594679 RepID=A0A0A8E6M2_9GAMM|nr:GDP-L-fucose synthase [Allofrancisella guangzhouensis]AJC49574.1 nodulation protein NolK [Allofrancisella guangzhouensis]MBK2027224.1 GDP-L-fucose synthase [Allofrancisella guangzhouensis]MBK2044660.1 GDP-L-fucose synthase [Allofrancisella guangzhouensis]MBK2045057.1 GDP-L-fucose synthase [Allofrancisella guangzhouensis]